MVARRAHNPKVRGSSPLPATLYSVLQVSNVRMSVGDFFCAFAPLSPLSLFAISKELFRTPYLERSPSRLLLAVGGLLSPISPFLGAVPYSFEAYPLLLFLSLL